LDAISAKHKNALMEVGMLAVKRDFMLNYTLKIKHLNIHPLIVLLLLLFHLNSMATL
jgi:hypothetical protein